MVRKFIPAAALVLMLTPAAAHADWLFTPTVGTTFGRDTHGREHLLLGTSFGWLDYDPGIGWEVNFSYAPDFFEGNDNAFEFGGHSHVGTLMLNGVIGDLTAGPDATGWRPYATAGIGVIQVRAITQNFAGGGRFDTWVHEVGFNAGGGVLVFLGRRVGIRTDLRYISSLEDDEPSWTKGRSNFDVAPGRFDFFRATVGVTFRFPYKLPTQ